ncbi:MAG: hypothetical protein FP814_00730 [Desulfobacterium sp.]|nr:hypothetical protein [Desulfobacterium sp.]MBU3948866.1 hypothetical protein [Pseudomonadota bacterium]MBU4009790.1 hypothetical protein [Pseudomonadota bacterium]MBU4036274.1 hypothetical protein [Pseudomonadota bacterium]
MQPADTFRSEIAASGMDKLDAYNKSLNRIPAPGNGCHPSLLSVSNYGVMAGLSPERICDDIMQHVPAGRRKVSVREVQDAVGKAVTDCHQGFTFQKREKPLVKDGQKTLQKIISKAKITEEVDLWEASPIRLLDKSEKDMVLLLEVLYQPDDLLFIGDRFTDGILNKSIRTASKWIEYFHNGGKTFPHILINPLTGKPAPKKTKEDEETYRSDANIQSYKYCLVEFDNIQREDQVKFWNAVKLPIVCLIDSGNKSVHAWLDVQKLANVITAEQWQSEIKDRLYDRILKPLGVDGACSNPARMSRLPGYYRKEKGNFQKLLWLSPEGKPLC